MAFFDGQVGLASEAGAGMHTSVERVRAYLEDVSRPKIACDLKALAHALGFEPGGFTRDVMLEGFLLAADPAACTLEAMCERLLDRKPGARADERADLVFRLAERFGPEIESQGLAAAL